jgi:hypothetical protein
MNKKIYLLLALGLPGAIQCMEEPVKSSLDALPIELKLTIAKHIEGTNCLNTIALIKQLGLISHAWEEVSRDNKLIKDIIERYKEEDRNNHESYCTNITKIRNILGGRKPAGGVDNAAKSEIKRLKSATFYSEFVHAARMGILPLIQLLLVNDPDLQLVTSDKKLQNSCKLDAHEALNQAFIVAVKHNNPALVSCLLAHGAEIDALDLQGRSAVFIALKKKFQTISEILRAARKDKQNNTKEL